MLIINIKNSERIKYKGRFFKKTIRPDPFTRESKIICGQNCTILEFDESSLEKINLERLLNTFKGKIIGPQSALDRVIPAEYRFDYKPYFKRALLSALINSISNDITRFSVSVNDNEFKFCDEFLELANAGKSFSLISDETADVKRLADQCFVEFGNFINVTDKLNLNDDIIIDFNDLDEACKILILKQGKEQLLYPDPRYFLIKEDLLPLVNLGIEPRILCAAFTVVA